jgi:hypothetical protein
LVFGKRYEEAEALLVAECERSSKNKVSRLPALHEVMRRQIDNLGSNDASMRRMLAGLHMLSDMLMEKECWADAEIVLNKLIELSLSNYESFFLTDSRFRRAICLKALGRAADYKLAKSEIPKGASILMRDGLWRTEDI